MKHSPATKMVATDSHLAPPRTCPLLFVNHSYTVASIAHRYGWHPGARYTNLRDVRRFDRVGFLDIDWKRYDFDRHIAAAKAVRPMVTVARDVERIDDLALVLEQAQALREFADQVIVVPKDESMAENLHELIPPEFKLGYSVPTRYGGTNVPVTSFDRPVHLLGGRPDVQARLVGSLEVFGVDCNRFTLDAAFGDYFDGSRFRPHPKGGYLRCIEESIVNITALWA